jgi:estrogen-related receptor ERR
MVEALIACEPDMLQVSTLSHTLDTDQRVLGQLSDLYDRELVGIIGKLHCRMSLINIFLYDLSL